MTLIMFREIITFGWISSNVSKCTPWRITAYTPITQCFASILFNHFRSCTISMHDVSCIPTNMLLRVCILNSNFAISVTATLFNVCGISFRLLRHRYVWLDKLSTRSISIIGIFIHKSRQRVIIR